MGLSLEPKDQYSKLLVEVFIPLCKHSTYKQKKNTNYKSLYQNILDLPIVSLPRIKGGSHLFSVISNNTSELNQTFIPGSPFSYHKSKQSQVLETRMVCLRYTCVQSSLYMPEVAYIKC